MAPGISGRLIRPAQARSRTYSLSRIVSPSSGARQCPSAACRDKSHEAVASIVANIVRWSIGSSGWRSEATRSRFCRCGFFPPLRRDSVRVTSPCLAETSMSSVAPPASILGPVKLMKTIPAARLRRRSIAANPASTLGEDRERREHRQAGNTAWRPRPPATYCDAECQPEVLER